MDVETNPEIQQRVQDAKHLETDPRNFDLYICSIYSPRYLGS